MPNPEMTYSEAGLALTKTFESCSLTAYLDSAGIPTIGYGHTAGVSLGDACTQGQAIAWLRQDIQWAVDTVNRLVTVPLTQGQFDALTDFVYNLGSGSLESSTLLKLVNQGNFADAANEFDKWDHAGGQVVAGLLRRREAEKQEFES
jgi:lysozyme